jgi:hypothetical protein
MWDALNRAERYRDLAEECRRVAAVYSSDHELRDRYLRLEKHWLSLAGGEELSTPASGG